MPEFNIVNEQFTFAMNKTWDVVNIIANIAVVLELILEVLHS